MTLSLSEGNTNRHPPLLSLVKQTLKWYSGFFTSLFSTFMKHNIRVNARHSCLRRRCSILAVFSISSSWLLLCRKQFWKWSHSRSMRSAAWQNTSSNSVWFKLQYLCWMVQRICFGVHWYESWHPFRESSQANSASSSSFNLVRKKIQLVPHWVFITPGALLTFRWEDQRWWSYSWIDAISIGLNQMSTTSCGVATPILFCHAMAIHAIDLNLLHFTLLQPRISVITLEVIRLIPYLLVITIVPPTFFHFSMLLLQIDLGHAFLTAHFLLHLLHHYFHVLNCLSQGNIIYTTIFALCSLLS